VSWPRPEMSTFQIKVQSIISRQGAFKLSYQGATGNLNSFTASLYLQEAILLHIHQTINELYRQLRQHFPQAPTLSITDFSKAVLGYNYKKLNLEKLAPPSSQTVIHSLRNRAAESNHNTITLNTGRRGGG
jgi:hypothetical protein